MKNPTLAIDNDTGKIDLNAWLSKLPAHYTHPDSLIKYAATLAQLTGDDILTPIGISCLQQGLLMGDILLDLNVDEEALAAGILYSCVRYADLNLEDIPEELSHPIRKIIRGVEKMDAIDILSANTSGAFSKSKMNIRKMLLAMVDDIRIVLLKLAERLIILRHASLLSEDKQKKEAHITHSIYAPLANRLGIGHIKWELEDFSLRYLQPNVYKKISQELNATRKERETYVQDMITLLESLMLTELHVDKVDVTGRAKHIYSIYKKMTRKHVELNEIYDALAFRILLPTVEDCYGALGQVHGLWQPIEKEFDDYIATPKPNGYRSIHTAVIGPDNKHIEVQIRTFQMHEEAELGVAAHWIYKEGAPVKRGYEAKIAWLRQLMDWQQEVTQHEDGGTEPAAHLFDDHIYVFTPQGDVLELPKGATPLDFAYHVHTDIGHRCRGAKINGQIVPLSYQLKMGDSVTILTHKTAQPSRDWLSPHTGYLKTSRAKAKAHQWFRQHDPAFVQAMDEVTPKAIAETDTTDTDKAQEIFKLPTRPTSPTDINIENIGNLLTTIALCCKPIPGDDIIGYITREKGVSIHKGNCPNIHHLPEHYLPKLINVTWGTKTQNKYHVELMMNAYDRQDLVRDVTRLLTDEPVNLLGLSTSVDKNDGMMSIRLGLELHGLNSLSRVISRLQQIAGVVEVKRI